ncbi:hypothetical protein Slin14017_G121150 [Septoria linicola]|nr:hypothetical protein Slin14017_G121150 [Septoria linicola]
MWEKFTSQIVDTARLSPKERAKVWAVGTAAAVTVSSPDSYHIGRNKIQRYEEEKVKEGLIDESEDSLGDLLRQWNEGYFAERGLLARLELCEAAQNSASQRSKIFQREAHWYPHKEDRVRARTERKFSLVITQMYKPEELAEEDMEPCDSTDVKHSIDSHRSEYAESAVSFEFKPLPDLPVGADPLLDIVTEFTNLQYYPADQLPPATQLAELEGDNKRAMLLDQEVGLPCSAHEHRDKKGADHSKAKPYSEEEAQNWALKDATDESNCTSPAQHAPLSRSRDVGSSPGLQEHNSGRTPESDHLNTEGHTTACGLQLADQQNFALHKPTASPTASFFMPLEFKPVGSMLDFDPKLVLQDVAIAH